MFSCDLIKPNLFLVRTQTPGRFRIIFTQAFHCLRQNGLLSKPWAVFENWGLSFWVSLCLHSKQASFSTKFTEHCFTCLSFIVLNGWKKRFLAPEFFGRLKIYYLLVVEWTKRSLSDIGEMNEPGQLVACLTLDDLQVFNILISIFGLARFKPWITWERRNCFLYNQITWKKSTLSFQ